VGLGVLEVTQATVVIRVTPERLTPEVLAVVVVQLRDLLAAEDWVAQV